MGPENRADAAAFLAQPTVQHAMCEDYRAGLGLDRANGTGHHMMEEAPDELAAMLVELLARRESRGIPQRY